MQKALLEQCEAVDAAVYVTRVLLSQVQKTLFLCATCDTEDESLTLTCDLACQLFSKPEELEVPIPVNKEESVEGDSDSKESGVPVFMVEPTEAEIAEDRHLRHKILLRLFQLACAMVRLTL